MPESKTLITCFTNPDLDGFACAVAYAELLNIPKREVIVGIFGEPHDEIKYLMEVFGFKYPLKIENPQDFEKIILVDASMLQGLPKPLDPKNVIKIVDHRKTNDKEAFPNAEIQIEYVGAAATLIAEKFAQTKTPLSKMSATLLYGAIISNTLNFQANVTTDRDKKMANWIKDQFKFPNNFAKNMFLAKSDLEGKKLSARLRGDFAIVEMASKRVGIGQIEMVGVRELVNQRKGELLIELEKIQQDLNLDMTFISLIDLEDGFNLFLARNLKMEKILEEVLKIKFMDNEAERKGLIMRKEIIPLLKEYLEKKLEFV